MVVESDAVEGEGIAELWDALDERRERLGEDGLRRRRRENLARELRHDRRRARRPRACAG